MWGGVCFMTRFLKELPCLWVMVTSLFLLPLSSVRKGRVLWPDDLLTGTRGPWSCFGVPGLRVWPRAPAPRVATLTYK